jgi:hypothetical protein
MSEGPLYRCDEEGPDRLVIRSLDCRQGFGLRSSVANAGVQGTSIRQYYLGYIGLAESLEDIGLSINPGDSSAGR